MDTLNTMLEAENEAEEKGYGEIPEAVRVNSQKMGRYYNCTEIVGGIVKVTAARNGKRTAVTG